MYAFVIFFIDNIKFYYNLRGVIYFYFLNSSLKKKTGGPFTHNSQSSHTKK